MKTLQTIVGVLFYVTLVSLAGTDVPVAWNASATPGVGYVVVFGNSSGNYTTTNNAGTNTTLVISNLAVGQYYAVVLATNITLYTNSLGVLSTNYGVSPPSNEIGIKVTPGHVIYKP